MLSLFLMALYLAIMNVSFQPQIASPPVGSDRACRRNRLSNEPVQARAGRVRYRTQANAPDALCIRFGGNDNQNLGDNQCSQVGDRNAEMLVISCSSRMSIGRPRHRERGGRDGNAANNSDQLKDICGESEG